MDCCNYVQPYPAHRHFYQQQHHFCYDNTNVYGTGAYGAAAAAAAAAAAGSGAGGAPVSDAIEANAARYNRLPPAYPTDYVYNPKEARLRKAMREQSRELSRQSILQTAIASASGSSGGGGGGVGAGSVAATGSANFLNHPLNCPTPAVNVASVAAAAVSSLPGSPSFNAGSRIINPWFPGGHPPNASHLKPILSPRVMTVAQHQQQQQRTFDKTKEVFRKQAECAAAFSGTSASGYPSEFSGHGVSTNLQGQAHPANTHEANDYCVIAEFSDGQKWHPYQNGPAPYHSRGGGPLTKMGALHPGVQSGNPHGHGGWNQFCGMPLSTPIVNRVPRHMVFQQQQQQQQQQQSQHCGFPEEMQIPYMQSKHMEIGHRLHPGYSQQEHQAKLQASSMSGMNMSQLREPEKCIEDGPRWESRGGEGTEGSMGAMVTGHSRRESDLQLHQKQQEQECDQSTSRDSRQQQQKQQQQQQQRERDNQQNYPESGSSGDANREKSSSKQPLPGFHQAFGSTEIGRFSRSEFFANMVGESSNVSTNNSRNSCSSSSDNGASDLVDSSVIVDNNAVRRVQTIISSSRNQQLRGDSNLSSGNDCSSQESTSNEDTTNGVSTIDPSFNNSLALAAAYYNDVRSPGPSGTGAILAGTTIPRWHSPYVSAIGSEI